MTLYRYTAEMPDELDGGRPLAWDDAVELSDEDILLPQTASLIASDRLIPIPVAKRVRPRRKTTDN